MSAACEGMRRFVACVRIEPKRATGARWAFVSAAGDSVAVWRTSDGSLFNVLEGHQGLVWALCRTNAGAAVFSGSEDGTVRQWYGRPPQPGPAVWHGALSQARDRSGSVC